MLRHLSEQLSRWILRGALFLRSKYVRRTLYTFSIVTILVGLFVFVNPVKAEFLKDVTNGIIGGVSYIMIAIAGLFIQLTIFALKFFIEVAGYNNFIDADVVQLGWNMVRDISNMFFVVVLLVIAFGTILGLEQYEWKKTLVKLIMAAFFVNFSNLICQLIIDVAQVFTITFLNALAGAAGGNLIKMFNFDDIYNIATQNTDPNGINIQLFGGAVMTVVFAGMAMFTMGAYLFVIIARMVVLWTLMILSPLAFLFSALPNTQSYAQEFWNEFIHHVIVAPVMVFFLWLAFATFGGGDVVQTNIEQDNPIIVSGGISATTGATDANGNLLGASFLQAASWENMANFAVAIAFLWVGIERVQKLGVVGGGIVSGALNFGKTVATIGSGLALGRWLGSGAKGLASKGVKAALWHAPLIGGEKWARRAKNQWEGAKSWYYDTGYRPKVKRDEKGKVVMKDGKAEFETDSEGQLIMEQDPDRSMGQKMAHWFAKQDISAEKKLDKTTKYAALQKEALDKRTTGVPSFWLMKDSEKADAIDRVLMGQIEGEKERSAAKTRHYSGKGKLAVLRNPRYKDGELKGDRGALAEELAKHNVEGENAANLTHALEEDEKDKILHGGTHTADHVTEQLEAANRKLMSPQEIAAADALKTAKARVLTLDGEAKVTVANETNRLDETFEPDRQRLFNEKKVATEALNTLKASDEYKDVKARLKEVEDSRAEMVAAGVEAAELEPWDNEISRLNSTPFGPDAKTEQQIENEAKAAEDAFTNGMQEQKKRKEDAALAIRGRFNTQIDTEGVNVEQNEAALAAAQKAALDARAVSAADVALAATVPDPADPAAVAAVATAKANVARAKAAADAHTQLEDQVEAEKLKIQSQAAKGSLGLRYAAAKQRASTAKSSTEAAESELQEASLGVENIRQMFNKEQSFKIGAQAAKGFIDGIQEEEIGKIFKKGSEDLKKAMDKAFKNGTTGLKDVKIDTENVGARLAKSQVLAEYNKDIAGVNKKAAVDEADSAFTLERYGFDAPASSFNEWVKKRMESFQGVEREQAVKIAIGSLSKLQSLQQKGIALQPDQEAQMMANVKYLTSQAWSDDLLARIVATIDKNKKGQLYGSEKDEAKKLEDVFVGALKWGSYDDTGKLTIENRSGHDRTNDLHRLTAFGGDIQLLQSENAVLRHSKETGLGYADAAGSLARKVDSSGVVALSQQLKTAKQAGDATAITALSNQISEIAKNFGITGKTAVEEIASFADRFVSGSVDAVTGRVADFTAVVDKFSSQIKSFNEATQMMADFKNLALATGHIDDGGHTKYDMDTSFAHGQLADTALNFVLSDWRKKNLDTRLGALKSHSVMYMDENSGTAYTRPEHIDAFRETFQGLENKLSFKRLDGRVIDHLATLAAGEAAIMERGKMVLGDTRSVAVKEDHGGDADAALKRIAQDLAVRLTGNALATVASLGERSGLGFDRSKAGEVNVTIAATGTQAQHDITDVADLVDWVKNHAGAEFMSDLRKKGFSERSIAKAFGHESGMEEEDDDVGP